MRNVIFTSEQSGGGVAVSRDLPVLPLPRIEDMPTRLVTVSMGCVEAEFVRLSPTPHDAYCSTCADPAPAGPFWLDRSIPKEWPGEQDWYRCSACVLAEL